MARTTKKAKAEGNDKEVKKNYLIFVDAKGKEISRKVKKQGRPPKGAVQNDDGNFIVPPAEEKFIPKYVNDDGSMTAKGRGRPKPGYVKATEGEYAGHWVKAEVLTPVSV